MSLENIMSAIATVEKDIVGIKRAYDQAPNSLNAWPCFVNFPDSGQIQRTTSLRIPVHTIKLLLFVLKGADLPSSEAKIRPFLDATLDAFDGHLTLNGACSNSRILSYKYGVLAYGGSQFLGISFDLEVTEWTGMSFTA